MKKSMKKGAVLSLAAILTLGLASCNNNDTPTSDSTSSDTTTSEQTSQESSKDSTSSESSKDSTSQESSKDSSTSSESSKDTSVVDPSVPTPETYEVTYELNGGKNAEGNPASYVEGTEEEVTLLPATKEGYDFIAWHKDTLEGDVITKITKTTKGNLKLVAEFKGIENLAITQAFGQSTEVGKTIAVNINVVNNGKEAYTDILNIAFKGTNDEKNLTLSEFKLNGEAVTAEEHVAEDGRFLGYLIKMNLKAGETAEVTALASATVAGTYKFQTTSEKSNSTTDTVEFVEAKEVLDITQTIPASFTNKANVEFKVKNIGNIDYDSALFIRFQGTNEDKKLTLAGFKVNGVEVKAEDVSERIVDGRFLGYDVKINSKVGEELTVTAEATTTVTKTFKFKTLTTHSTSSTFETAATYEAPAAKLAITQEIPAEFKDTAEVKFTVVNSGNAATTETLFIRFQGTNTDKSLTLAGFKVNGVETTATEWKPAEEFLGYDVEITVKPGETVTVTATATATKAATYTFKTLTETKESSSATVNTTIIEAPVEVLPETVTITASKNTMTVEETLELTAAVAPKEATNKELTWSVKPVDEVNKGVVTLSATTGETVTVTATTAGTVVVLATSVANGEVVGSYTITVEEKATETLTEFARLSFANSGMGSNYTSHKWTDTSVKGVTAKFETFAVHDEHSNAIMVSTSTSAKGDGFISIDLGETKFKQVSFSLKSTQLNDVKKYANKLAIQEWNGTAWEDCTIIDVNEITASFKEFSADVNYTKVRFFLERKDITQVKNKGKIEFDYISFKK